MTNRSGSPVSKEMLSALRRRMVEGQELLPLDKFIECALYDPQCGYYMQDRERVGRSDHADFYTASSLGSLFAKMVVEAAGSLTQMALDSLHFIEFGPESREGLLGLLPKMPFKDYRQIRPGDRFEIPHNSVVFSNELFDAQPFRRFARKKKRWLEACIRIEEDHLAWDYAEPQRLLPSLPSKAPDGYIVDWPSGAHALLEKICQSAWKGVFIAFDYGLDRSTVLENRPEGTGRTYAGHKMGSELLETPGERDITCHLIWDELSGILRHWGFEKIQLQSQEAFLMHHCGSTIGHVIEASPPGLSREKQTLMELLHPDNMGHKFQVLHARRGLH